MKAMILAAGLGTRLRPWTLEHPKALVPVGGVPMLERVIVRLKEEGFNDIVVNIHHFGDQIIDFLGSKDFGVRIGISDERGNLLDTGGGLVYADRLLGDEPVLVHNVDILSNADLQTLMRIHKESQAGGSLLVNDRESSRKLIFDSEMKLKGWHHLGTDEYKPKEYTSKEGDTEYAFSGIYVTNGEMRREMRQLFGESAFPVMDYFLSKDRKERVDGVVASNLNLIDIGKPATLKAAQLWW
ncbi:MAG: nucleotidyltransferase family protein [Muribaculaceae bacterium]|nr:nucleotidyltransferase family protein [Muribaculaceae bacterium]